jgi:transposase, IS5 family
MYRSNCPGQLSFENFYLPFGGKLSGENRWVKLAQMIPWETFESEYAAQMSQEMGSPAKSFRMALGALIIKEQLGTSDAETVEQIRENLYFQYFIGLSEYRDEAPFESSMMVHFRKRISGEMVCRINEQMVTGVTSNRVEQTEAGACLVPEEGKEERLPPHQGKLIVDASCAPADITYPTDLKLLNEAREKTEAIIDELYAQLKDQLGQKPRTYRHKARQEYLKVAKQRKAHGKTVRKAVRQQLGYLRRNLGHIDELIAAGASLSQLKTQQYRTLLVISEVFRQQEWMYNQHQHRIDDRIVSLSQPHVRSTGGNKTLQRFQRRDAATIAADWSGEGIGIYAQ